MKTINLAPDWVPLTKFYINLIRNEENEDRRKSAEDFFLEMAQRLDDLNKKLANNECIFNHDHEAEPEQCVIHN